MKLVLITGLKGGVGKTTVAIGLARALSSRGYSVGVLDLDYRTPNVPVALDNGQAQLGHSYEGDVLIPPEIDGLRVMSMAYIWPEWKCVQVSDEDAMHDVVHLLQPEILAWGQLDFLVVDTPPTSVGVVQVALEAPGVLGALVVSHASRVARMDTVRTFDLFREKEIPIIGLVCNQVGLHDLAYEDMLELARRFDLPFCVSIPHVKPPAALHVEFGSVADAVLGGKTTILKVQEPEDAPWKTWIALSKSVSGKPAS